MTIGELSGHPLPLTPLFSIVCVARLAWLTTVTFIVDLSPKEHPYLWVKSTILYFVSFTKLLVINF